MKTTINVIVIVITFLCLCVIAYVRFGIGFPVWDSDNFENINAALENLSYSYIAGVVVYLLTIVLPDIWESKRLKPIVDNKILYIGKLLNKQMWGFGSLTSTGNGEKFVSVDCTEIDKCLALLDETDWNAKNPVVKNRINNKYYQTYKQDLDKIFQEIKDILQTYQKQLSKDNIVNLENIKQASFVTQLNVLYEFNAEFPKDGHEFIIRGHKVILENYSKILKDRNISFHNFKLYKKRAGT